MLVIGDLGNSYLNVPALKQEKDRIISHDIYASFEGLKK